MSGWRGIHTIHSDVCMIVNSIVAAFVNTSACGSGGVHMSRSP